MASGSRRPAAETRTDVSRLARFARFAACAYAPVSKTRGRDKSLSLKCSARSTTAGCCGATDANASPSPFSPASPRCPASRSLSSRSPRFSAFVCLLPSRHDLAGARRRRCGLRLMDIALCPVTMRSPPIVRAHARARGTRRHRARGNASRASVPLDCSRALVFRSTARASDPASGIPRTGGGRSMRADDFLERAT